MLKKIIDSLKLPEYKNVTNLDHPTTTELHAKIIQKKPFLRKLYIDFYKEFKSITDVNPDGTYLELGSGGGFIKDIIPNVITSDILAINNIDFSFSAERLPLKNNSVDGIFMINVFHHIKNPVNFFKELDRCLKRGGKVLMIETAKTAFSEFVFKNFHHEIFDPSEGWTVDGEGPLSASNEALPWIIFCRDRERFENEFGKLRINKIKCHTPFRYLISGGISFKQLLPTFTYPLIKFLEVLLTPFNRWIGLLNTIELEKII